MCKHHKVVFYISILSAIVSVSEQALLAVPTQHTAEHVYVDVCSAALVTRACLSTLTLLPDTSQLTSCISKYTCQVPHFVNRDKSAVRKLINSWGVGTASLLAEQSMLSLTGKAAGRQSPRLPDRPAPSAAPPEQWDRDGHGSTCHPRKAGRDESPLQTDVGGSRATSTWGGGTGEARTAGAPSSLI